MNEEIITIQREIAYQRKSIDALLSITTPGDDSHSIETISKKAIGVIQEITGFRTITFRIYDPQEKCFKIMAHSNMTNEMVKQLYQIPDYYPVFAEIMEKKEAVVIAPIEFVQELGYKRTLFIPLVAGDTIVGSIDLPTKTEYYPDDDEFRWFALVGRILGSMVYQVQLIERVQSMAVIRERNRMVSELHDDFAQCVRSMQWGLDEARTALEHKLLEQADGILENLSLMVQNTSTYLREEMLGLRERVNSDKGIIEVFARMLTRFERNWGIKTELVTERNVSENHKTSLSSSVEIQLIRIVQEALMNVRRHSNAETIMIKFTEDIDGIVIEVIDNGIGFRMEDIPQERLGLRVIQERAASMGATVQIDSVEKFGTTLEIKIPNHFGALL